MALTTSVLIALCSFYAMNITITMTIAIWLLTKLQFLNVTLHRITTSYKIIALFPIMIYLLIQASNITIILHFHQIQNWEFFGVSLGVFILYRLASIALSIISTGQYNFKFLILSTIYNGILDASLYRSLSFQYVTGGNQYQRYLFYIQFNTITIFQFIYCILSSMSGDNSFIIKFGIITSIIGSFYNVFMPIERYENVLFMLFYMIDIFSQLMILILIYSISYIGFYTFIIIKLMGSCILYRLDAKNIHFSIIPSIYRINSFYGDKIPKSAAVPIVTNILLMIGITIFMHFIQIVNYPQNSLNSLLIISWIISICPHFVFLTIYTMCVDKSDFMHPLIWEENETYKSINDKVNKFIGGSEIFEKYMQAHYYKQIDSIDFIAANLRDLQVEKEILADRMWKPRLQRTRLLLTGPMGCIMTKKIGIDILGEEKIKKFQDKRQKLVDGYMRCIEREIDFYVLPEIIPMILLFYGMDSDIHFCCSGKPRK